MKKKIIAVLLSACMLVSACPTGAFAMSDEETNTYTATGDVMQGGTSVVDETPAPEATEAPEQTPTPAPEETPAPAPVETPAPVEVEAQSPPPATATRLTVGMTQTATRLQRFPEQLPSPHTGKPIPKRNTPLSIGLKMRMITSIPQRILKKRPAPQTAERMLKQNLIPVLPHRRLSRRPLPVTAPQS